MSKTLFRSRSIEPERPILIYHLDELNDLNDFSSVSRPVTQMPTGMEKEEESEEHIQAAMEAQSTYGGTRDLIIPVPNVYEVEPVKYPSNRRFSAPKEYIRQNIDYQEVNQKYDADSNDEHWLADNRLHFDKHVDKINFEKCIDKLEWLNKYQPYELQINRIVDILILSPIDANLIFEYWRNKRLLLKPNCSLIPEIRTEQIEGINAHDPYVAFRKRFEKMQTRKNRKCDETMFEKLIHTHVNLVKIQKISKSTLRREELKLELQNIIKRLFNLRLFLNDHKNDMMKKTLSIYYSQQKENYSHISSSLVGMGVTEYDCFLYWKTNWRVNNMFSYNLIKNPLVSSFVLYNRSLLNKTATFKNIHKSKPVCNRIIPITRIRDNYYVRCRLNRNRQIIRDSVDLIQSVEIVVKDSNPVPSKNLKRDQTPDSHIDVNIEESKDTNISEKLIKILNHKLYNQTSISDTNNNIINGVCADNIISNTKSPPVITFPS